MLLYAAVSEVVFRFTVYSSLHQCYTTGTALLRGIHAASPPCTAVYMVNASRLEKKQPKK